MLEICPMTLKEANSYVEQYHRHHRPVVGHKFLVGCSDGDKIVGVAIVGRPVARHLDDGCEKCRAQTPCYNTYPKAKEAWNRRADDGN